MVKVTMYSTETCPYCVRAEQLLKKRGVTYAQLVEKLAEVGVSETEPNIRNKLARGKFTAVFFIQCLMAIGSHVLRLDES